MASQITLPSDLIVSGAEIAPRKIYYPKEGITDDAVAPLANIGAAKLVHQHAVKYAQPNGTNVVAADVLIHTFKSAAEIVHVEVVPTTPPAGGDLAYTVDVQKGNASTAFASILSAVITVDPADPARTPIPGIITTDDAADGDTLRVVVALTGTTGTQGQGFLLSVWVREEP